MSQNHQHHNSTCHCGCGHEHTHEQELVEAPTTAQLPPARQDLLTFPCEYPLKAFGKADKDFLEHVHGIIVNHVPQARREDFTARASSKGNYVALTITLTLESQEQLNNIYTDLKNDARVLTAL